MAGKTIQQAGGETNVVMDTASAITQVGSVQEAQLKQDLPLSRDLLSAIGETAKLTQEIPTKLSVDAAQRVVDDNNTKMALLMTENENLITNATTPEELESIQKRQSLEYSAILGKTSFDTPEAQRTFDKGFEQQTGKAVAVSNAKMEVMKIEKLDVRNYRSNVNNLELQYSKGISASKDSYKQTMKSMTSGAFTKEEAENDISGVYIQSLNTKYYTLKNLPIYDENGDIDMEVASKVYNDHFGTQSEMFYDKEKDDGKGGWSTRGVGDVDTNVVSDQQRAFKTLLDTVTKETQNMTINKETTPITSGSKDAKAKLKAMQDADKSRKSKVGIKGATVTLSEQTNTNKAIAQQKSIISVSANIENSIDKVVTGEIRWEDLNVNISRNYQYVNETTGEVDTGVLNITASDVVSLYKKRVSLEEEVLKVGTPEEINKSVAYLTKLENQTAGKIKSPYINGVYTDLNDGIISGQTSLKGMKNQLTIANTYGAMHSDSSVKFSWLNQQDATGASVTMNNFLLKFDEYEKYMTNKDGTIDPKKEKEVMVKMSFLIHSKQAQYEKNATLGEDAKRVRTIAKKQLEENTNLVNWGFGSETMDTQTLNTILSSNSALRIQNKTEMEDFAKNLIDSNQVMEISSSIDWVFTGDSIMIVTPDGAENADTVMAKIQTDLRISLKDTKFADVDFGEDTNVAVFSDKVNGKLGTIVEVTNKQTGEIMYQKVYTGSELAGGVSNEEQAELDEINKKRLEKRRKTSNRGRGSTGSRTKSEKKEEPKNTITGTPRNRRSSYRNKKD